MSQNPLLDAFIALFDGKPYDQGIAKQFISDVLADPDNFQKFNPRTNEVIPTENRIFWSGRFVDFESGRSIHGSIIAKDLAIRTDGVTLEMTKAGLLFEALGSGGGLASRRVRDFTHHLPQPHAQR